MVSIWQELIIVFGGNATLLLVLGFLFKSLLSHMLTKDVEKYKAELNADADLLIERLKSTLQIVALEHQVRFSKLHQKRAEAIEELNKRAYDLEQEAARYASNFGQDGPQAYQRVKGKVRDFHDFCTSHQIYLSDEMDESLYQVSYRRIP